MASSLCIALVCFSGGLLSGVTGFGALIIIVPLLALLLEISVAIPLGVLCGVFIQGSAVMMFRTHIEKKALLHLLLGSLPGVWLGSTLLLSMPEIWLRAVLGILVICYVLWSVFSKLPPPSGPPGTIWAYVAGFFSGAFGGAFGVIGPPAVIYATRTGWHPDTIRAFLGVFFAVLFFAIAVSQYLHGLMGPQVWATALWAIPASLAGCLAGRRLTARMAREQYMRLVFILLFVMGLSLCWPIVRASIFN